MSNIDIILINPQMGENIGAAARAMANFGFKTLKIVNPRDGWPSDSAIANAVGAFDQMNEVQVFDNTADALVGYHQVYATTARPRDMRKAVYTPESACTKIIHDNQSNLKSAILFGGERAGLTNEDIALAHHIITVPTNAAFSSLNLAQSVLLIAHEMKRQSAHEVPACAMPLGDSAPVSHEELETLINRLDDELQARNFFRNPDMKPTMMRNIRGMITRNNLTEQEVRTFQGIISALIGNKTR